MREAAAPLQTSENKELVMRKRPIELKFRLSADEYELLKGKLKEAGMSRNAFLVRLIVDAEIYPKDQLQELNVQYDMMNRLLRGVATNINQIAKHANTSRTIPSAKLLLDMYQDVQVLKNNLQPLWEETRSTLWQS